ncbi:hypothetical protein CNMCM6106_006881 [Aspergillus hiratsukae]|uniref:Uncharacterized protein n=1 Tax=Aspergillus hiratsukae TaxID=1194566 RepID=A0A8H6QIZ1_9EURO|nr:hypothetical protein CNMCM6106_006881 [Aspergillus hiratsukae]
MSSKNLPKLMVLFENGAVGLEDALKKQPDLVLETLISAFLSLPVNEETLTRIRLGGWFRRSLQASRQTTPYRLQTVIAECKSGKADKASLEARFFAHGGVRAVAALAAAATDEKQVVRLLKGLPEPQLLSILKLIDTFEPHRDFLYIVETLDRRKPSKLSKRKYIPGPRSRRRSLDSHFPNRIPQKSTGHHAACGSRRMLSSPQESRLSSSAFESRESTGMDDHPSRESSSPLETSLVTSCLTNTGTNTTSAPIVGTRQSTAHDITADTGRRIKPVVGLEYNVVPTVQFQEDTLAETNRIFPPGKYQDRLCLGTYLQLSRRQSFPEHYARICRKLEI